MKYQTLTPYDERADVVIHEPIGAVFALVMEAMGP